VALVVQSLCPLATRLLNLALVAMPSSPAVLAAQAGRCRFVAALPLTAQLALFVLLARKSRLPQRDLSLSLAASLRPVT
jgi:hypothetical protein